MELVCAVADIMSTLVILCAVLAVRPYLTALLALPAPIAQLATPVTRSTQPLFCALLSPAR